MQRMSKRLDAIQEAIQEALNEDNEMKQTYISFFKPLYEILSPIFKLVISVEGKFISLSTVSIC